jgi:1-acyl-sn-glycerol-3-phosphate acyltransferase
LCLIERGNREQSNLAIDQAVVSLREGSSFLIFPEGTRSQTDELLPFKFLNIVNRNAIS